MIGDQRIRSNVQVAINYFIHSYGFSWTEDWGGPTIVHNILVTLEYRE